MKFSEYIKIFINENTPEGDFARDFIASKSRATTYDGIAKSVKKHHPCDNALCALESLYSKYLQEYNNLL